jgi:L-aminopeptidase/D-esterase-like protein
MAVPNLASVSGITVGHATDAARWTGCTVVLAPPGGMRATATLRGRATGTRELDALTPRHVVGHVDALLLTGGSAFGVGAADGVMRWVAERGRGFPVGRARRVPIVPTAVIFDFDLAPDAAPRWPTADGAYRARDAASSDIPEGSVGAGTGATVGKALGPHRAVKGDVVVGALVVLNAVGNVLDAAGVSLAGARGLARRIVPFATQFDGDIVFALSTAALAPAHLLRVEALAAHTVPAAVERAVRLAQGTREIPGLRGGRP